MLRCENFKGHGRCFEDLRIKDGAKYQSQEEDHPDNKGVISVLRQDDLVLSETSRFSDEMT